MGALSFANPAYLAALGLLAVPLVLHLMHRVVPRRVVFPTIRFILKGQEEQQGRRSLRDLLTLLARLLLLAAAVLLFAGPRLSRPPAAVVANGEETVLLLDVSLSMSAVDYDAYIRDQVVPILATHPEGSVALVVSGDGLVRRLPLGTSRALLEAAVRESQPQLRRGRHDEAWQILPRMFSDLPGVRRSVVVCSDLQHSDWIAFPAIARALGDGVTVTPLPPADRPAANLAITGVTSEVLSRGDTRRIRATVQVRNFALVPAKTRLTLRAGRQTVSRDLEAPAGAAEKVVVELDSPDGNNAQAELAADPVTNPFAADDTWHFWIGPRPPISVAVVAANASEQGLELFFLRKALTTNLPALARIEARFFGPEFFTEQNPQAFQRIVLLDTGKEFGKQELTVLKEFVEHGGDLVYFAGTRTAGSLAAFNSGGLVQTRFLGLQGALHDVNAVNIAALTPGTDVLAMFEREPSDLYLFPIYRHARYEPAAGSTVLLSLPNNLPFLVRETVGTGHVYLFAVGLAPSWSELPTALAYLPMLRRILESGLDTQDAGVINMELGDPLAARLEQLGIEPTDVVAPTAPGIVLVGATPIVSNVTRAESEPRYLDELDWLGATGALADSAAGQGVPAISSPGSSALADTSLSLRPALAAAVLVLLLLELLVANWWTRRRTV